MRFIILLILLIPFQSAYSSCYYDGDIQVIKLKINDYDWVGLDILGSDELKGYLFAIDKARHGSDLKYVRFAFADSDMKNVQFESSLNYEDQGSSVELLVYLHDQYVSQAWITVAYTVCGDEIFNFRFDEMNGVN